MSNVAEASARIPLLLNGHMGLIGGELEVITDCTRFMGPISSQEHDMQSMTLGVDWLARMTAGSETLSAWSLDDSFYIGFRGALAHGYTFEPSKDLHYKERFMVYDHTGDLSYVISPPANGGRPLNPRTIEGMPISMHNKSTWTFPKVELEDEEWDILANPPNMYDGNIVRDALRKIRNQEGYIWPAERSGILAIVNHGFGEIARRAPKYQTFTPLFERVLEQLI